MRYFYLLFIILFACKKHSGNEWKQIIWVQSFDELPGELFFGKPSSMYSNAEGLYFSDNERGIVFFVNKEFSEVQVFGKKGEAPHELNSPSNFFIYEGNLYCLDQGKNSIVKYRLETGEFLESFRIPRAINGSDFELRFFVEKNEIFLSAPYSQNAYVRIQNDSTFTGFGEKFNFGNPKTDVFRNERFLFKNQDKIIALSSNMPFIEMFDLNGNLILKEDISTVPAISERLQFIENENDTDPNSYYRTVKDAYFSENKLYILAISGIERPMANKILVFEFSEHSASLNYQGEITLPGTWYASFSVFENNLYVYENRSGQIHHYTF
jgi:hypothetical protein